MKKNLLFIAELFHDSGVAGLMVLGLVNSILAQTGDLIESKIKRIFKVKDSGKLLLAHGGILDRLDGFTLVLPFNALIMYYLVGC